MCSWPNFHCKVSGYPVWRAAGVAAATEVCRRFWLKAATKVEIGSRTGASAGIPSSRSRPIWTAPCRSDAVASSPPFAGLFARRFASFFFVCSRLVLDSQRFFLMTLTSILLEKESYINALHFHSPRSLWSLAQCTYFVSSKCAHICIFRRRSNISF